MPSDRLSLPDLPMPPGRARARHHALLQEITSSSAVAIRRPAYWRFAVPTMSAVAVAVAITVAFSATGRTSLAASWTATPTAAATSETASWGDSCLARLTSRSWPIEASSMTVVLAERRGPLTAVLMSGDAQYGMCITGPHGHIFSGIGSLGGFRPQDGVVLDGQPGQINGVDPFRLAYGQVVPGVSKVVIEVVDGTEVEATTAQGRFFAWWPSGADVRTITAMDSTGRVLRVLRPPSAPEHPSPARQPPGT